MNESAKNADKTGGKNRTQKVAHSVTEVMGGNFLTREYVVKQLPFLIFIVLLSLLYIANSYSSEKLAIKTERLKKANEELRYEQILMKSKLMHYSRQSEVARKLKDTGLKESTIPPHKIIVKTTQD
ncbi:MAG: hypothetical protein IH597_12020 [Bacteroidales bacterium]|nr:hypothetical protein [Bacteroidales bacterium]